MNGTAVMDPSVYMKMEKSSGIGEPLRFATQDEIAKNFLDFPVIRKYVIIDGELYLVSDEIPPEINLTK